MKGIIFTEFIAFMEAAHGPDFSDDVIYESGLADRAAYTSVGTYDFSQMQMLLTAFCKKSNSGLPDALRSYGRFLSRTFQSKHRDMYAQYPDIIEFVSSVENHIHMEVRKLYPDAQLPRFDVLERTPDRLVISYRSCRPLVDLAAGLIEGSAAFYGQEATVRHRRQVADDGEFHIIELDAQQAVLQ